MARYPDNTNLVNVRSNVKETLLAEIIAGNNIQDAAKLPGMPTTRQIKLLLAQDTKFRDDFIEAQRIALIEQLSRVVEMSDGVDGYDVARDRLRINTRLKVAEKLLPEIYGKRETVTHEAGQTLAELINENTDAALELPNVKVNAN